MSTGAIVFFGIFAVVAIVLTVVGMSKFMKIRNRLHRRAIACIGDEVSIYTDKGARYAYKGVYAYLNGDYSRALTHLEQALKYSLVSHNSSFCLDWISRCYEAQDKPVESLTYSVKAVEAEPSNVKSLFNLAEAYARDGVFGKAEFYYNTILRYDADNASAVFMLGMLEMGRGEYDDAEVHFLRTVELDPKFSAAYAELAVLMAIKGDYSRTDVYRAKVGETNRADIMGLDAERLNKRVDSIKRIQELCCDNQ
jgi:tetratricopeptide (TPR) repeat protein